MAKRNTLWHSSKLPKFYENEARYESDPEILWKEALKYFEFVDNNPFIKQDFVRGGDMAGNTVDIEQKRPYTLQGLTIFLGIRTIVLDRWSKSKKDPMMMELAKYIMKIVENNKLEGGMTGTFVPSIVIRDLGLSEKIETNDIKYTITKKN